MFYCVANDMGFFEQRHTTTVELTSHFIQQLLPLIKRNCFTESPLNFPVPHQKNEKMKYNTVKRIAVFRSSLSQTQ